MSKDLLNYLKTTRDFPTEIVFNKELLLAIRENTEGYWIDIYKHSNLDEPLESDYITSTYVPYTKLTNDIEIVIETTDGTDESYIDDTYELRGSDLYCNDELIEEDVASLNDLCETLECRACDYVSSITLDGEEILRDD